MYLRIKDLREDRDLTQKKIADYLHCNQSLYSKYEREVRDMPADLIKKLAEFYDVSVDYIMGRTNHPKVNHVKEQQGEE